jgi:carbon-monoxide dehydrogenase medium subunit
MSAMTTEITRFAFLRPERVEDAVAAGATAGAGGRYWAGGTDLMLEWQRKQRQIDTSIDITGLAELRGIEVGPSEIRIGALTTLAEIERSAARHPDLETLAAIAAVMCTPQTRTLATVAGNLCNASPAADLAPPLMALGARISTATSSGGRELELEDLFAAPKQTVLADGELLTHITIPLGGRRAVSYGRIARTVVDIALTLSACALTVDEHGVVTTARIAFGSVAPTPVRAPSGEALLLGTSLVDLTPELLAAAATAAAGDSSPIDDIRTSAAYRRHAVRVLTQRALTESAARLSAGGNR